LVISRTRLSNGTRVVSERMPDAHSVTIGFWVGAGSRHEDPAIAGASHFLEHLLFKGTEARSARDIAEAIEAVGGEMNAFTTKEYTAFYTRLLATDLDLSLDILCDIMSAPAFRPDEIDAERRVILEEILMHEDEPSDLVHDLFLEALYPGHPLGREVLGDATTIGAMTRDAIIQHFESHYRPRNIVVAVAGRIEHEELLAGLDRRWSTKDGGVPEAAHVPIPPAVPLVVHTRPTEQGHLVVGMPALARDDEDRFALSIVNEILGGGMSSRLFQEIREKRGLAYSVYSYRAAYQETGALAVYAGTTPEHVHEVLALIGAELDRVLADGISEREVAIAKGHIKGSLALSLEDSAGRMSRIGRGELVHGEVLSFDELAARTEAVSDDDLRRVIDRVFSAERVTAVVGPFDADDFEARVA
jgi:predicted Zn-dependent peptidase